MKLPDAFSPEVMAELARPYSPADPRASEITDVLSPKWQVVEVASREVEKEMIKRRFGIYIPECEETTISRGRKITRRRPMFAGYVFVFMWLTAENWYRLGSIEGVVAVLGSLSDEELDKIRITENTERPIVLEHFFVDPAEAKKRRKRYRKRNKTIMVGDEIVATRPWSAFEDAMTSLDSSGRNQALRDFLGISS